MLLRRGADVHMKDDVGRTPLGTAFWFVRPQVAQLLIEHGADVNAANEGGCLMHDAAWSGCIPLIDVLLRHGAEINARDQEGITPLGRAIAWGNTAAADFLREHGGVE